MKKTTAFFLTVGVLAMIIGGIGSITYFRRAEHSMTETKQEQYTIKNKQGIKEVHLNLSGNAQRIKIYSDDSNKIKLNTKNYLSYFLNSSLSVKEESDKLTATIKTSQKKRAHDSIQFNIFDRGSITSVAIPANTEKLVISGNASGDIDLSDLTIENLAVEMTNADLSFSNLNAKEAVIHSDHGDVSIYGESKIEKSAFSTKNGDIRVAAFTSSEWSVHSRDGDVSLEQVKGNVTLESTNGDITVTDLKGEAAVKSVNGDFELYGTEIPKKLSVELKQGDIEIYPEEILYDTAITAEAHMGDSSIFNKNRTSYKQGKETNVMDLKTKYGDITIDGPSEYEED
ncbi:DUF4097 family beta strand repeat protein [Erwinia sp. CPCC 100877]|nr:DUF4097 family beta strand repeat protein [Erwinia sp. CPCC 100877]